MKFDTELDFICFIENTRKIMSIDGNVDISLIDWYKIPLLDSIVSNKQMVEYLLINSVTREAKSFIVTKHKNDNNYFVLHQIKNDVDLEKIIDCNNSKIEKEYYRLIGEMEKENKIN